MKWVRIGAVEEQAITAVYEFLSGLCVNIAILENGTMKKLFRA